MEKIEFENKFGLLFETHFYVMQSGLMKKYYYHNFRKIRLFKTRNYHYNLGLLLVSMMVIVLGFCLRIYDPLMIVLGAAVGVLLLYFSYYTKKYKYQLHMVTVHYEPIVVDVADIIHEEAKTIVRKLNSKLKEPPTYLRAV